LERRDFFFHFTKSDVFTAEQLAGHASPLMVAGAETTATAATRAIWFLGKNPACHQQLKDEIRSVFTSPEQITGDATAQLPYLNAVVEESLRIVPPVGFGLLHDSNSRKFDEPDLFKPERWLKRLPETEKSKWLCVYPWAVWLLGHQSGLLGIADCNSQARLLFGLGACQP
jgi:cytochrome P450